jgi:hypothetical protein
MQPILFSARANGADEVCALSKANEHSVRWHVVEGWPTHSQPNQSRKLHNFSQVRVLFIMKRGPHSDFCAGSFIRVKFGLVLLQTKD